MFNRFPALVRSLRLPALILTPIALLGVARAQRSEVLGPRNAAFLEGLWRYGYIEQADKLGQLVAASDLPAAEKAAVDTLHRRLKIAIATQQGDWQQRRDLVLKEIEAKLTKMRAADPATEAASDLVGEVVEQHRLLADAVCEAFEKEQDPEKVATLRKDTHAAFDALEAELTERRKAVEKLRDDEKPNSELPLLVAFYGLARVTYYHSLILKSDAAQMKHKAEQALTLFEEFDLEFSDSLAAFEAKLTQALCHKALGNMEQAIACCDDAIALRELSGDKAKDGSYPKVDKDAADVISAAVLQKTLLFEDQKEWNKIIDAAKDYLATIPHALDALQGKAVLAAQAKAHEQLGETEAATKLAQQLIEIDPKGMWGYRGQELLSRLITGGKTVVGPEKQLEFANSLASQKEFEQALRMCRGVLVGATGEGAEKFAAASLLLIGAIEATRDNLHEAAVAWDAVVRRYPKSEQAPDALYRLIKCYGELEDSDQLPMFKGLVDERSKQLVRDYPTHQFVAQLELRSAQQLERQRKYLDAAKAFEAIASSSAVYLEARYHAANSYRRHARSLEDGGDAKAAAGFDDKARGGFESLLTDVASKRAQETDKSPKVMSRYDQIEIVTRIALTQMLLNAKGKAAEAEKILDKIAITDEDRQAPSVWALRIRLRLEQGQVDQAAAALEAALAKVPDSRELLGTCRPVAGELDRQAVERNKVKEYTRARELWARATSFYIRGASGAAPTEVSQIADRLRTIGMVTANIDESIESWFEVRDMKQLGQTNAAWDAAAQLYNNLSAQGQMTYKTRIGYARVLGFQGKFNDAQAELGQVFATEKLISNQRVDSNALARKPELLTAYVEYAWAMTLATGAEEKALRAKATTNFSYVVNSVPDTLKPWYFCRFGTIQSLFARGLYQDADLSLKSLERTNPEFDADKYGLKTKLRSLKIAIAEKQPR